MKGRYLNAQNEWEIAWNEALDRIDQQRKEGSSQLVVDPYKEAWNASDARRIEEGALGHEWNYELCRKYTSLELENQKTLRDWGTKYMSEEQSDLEKRQRERIKLLKDE